MKDKTIKISRNEFFKIASEEISELANSIAEDGIKEDMKLAIITLDLVSTVTARIAVKMFKDDKEDK